HGQRPGKVAEKHPAPMTQDTRCGDTGTTIQQRQRRQHEHPGQQVEAHQVEHDEADREEGCPSSGDPVCMVMVMANTAASARIAPAMKARIRVSRTDMNSLDSPASTILETNSAGTR